jgi:hypothetical protein
MIKLRIETEIKKPVKEVYSTFINRSLMSRWQPGLLSDEVVVDKQGRTRYEMKLNLGNRNMIMTETILKKEFPEYHTLYELKGIKNEVHNRFEMTGPDVTRWIYSTEFRFKGIMLFVGLFMRAGLEQQSKLIMKNFKSFVEKQ